MKQFRQPAPNEERVLAAFEEEGWPERIDDPIPPLGDVTPKERLHSTIWALNRHQEHKLLKFHGDGGGEGIRWSAVSEPAPAQNEAPPLRRTS